MKDKLKQFYQGLKVVTGKADYARGDKNLAIAANMLKLLIPIGGIGVVRGRTNEVVERILKEKLKKNPTATVDDLVSVFLDTPDFMDLLKLVDMGEKDLRFFTGETLRQWGKG